MSLSKLQEQWIQLYDELGGNFEGQVLAAPFVSVLEDTGEVASPRQILLVGKATKDDWDNQLFESKRNQPLTERLKERRSRTLKHIKEVRSGRWNRSAFWRFRNCLEQTSSQVIWTNLAKIGAERLNPHWRLVQRQSQLAQRTLQAELEEHKPILVVLVTGSFGAKEIAVPVFGPDDSWRKSRDKTIWWKERTQTKPAVLWVDHPQGKPKHVVDRWLMKAQDLIR